AGREVVHLWSRTGELGLGLEGVDDDHRTGLEGREQLHGLEEQLTGREYRALQVVTPVLIALTDAAPGALERLRQRCGVHDHGVAWQVIEQRCGGLEEQRLVELDACRGGPLAHPAVD